MSESTRRKFLRDVSLGLGAAGVTRPALTLSAARSLGQGGTEPENSIPGADNLAAAVDFRYSPLSFQTAYCFPDDHHKSLVGERGELRCGHPGQGAGIAYFPEVVEFSLLGMEADEVRGQQLESPQVPIVHTRIERPGVLLELDHVCHRAPGRRPGG